MDRPFRLTQCCTQFKSPGDNILCVLCLHYYVAFTFKWYGNSWNKNVLFPIGLNWVKHWVSRITGSPSSKYEHRRTSALLRNIQNIRICMGQKPIVSVTHENERISIKNSLPYLKCVTSLLCGPRVDLWPFYGFLCKRFSLYIKVYQGWARKTAVNLLQSPPNSASR